MVTTSMRYSCTERPRLLAHKRDEGFTCTTRCAGHSQASAARPRLVQAVSVCGPDPDRAEADRDPLGGARLTASSACSGSHNMCSFACRPPESVLRPLVNTSHLKINNTLVWPLNNESCSTTMAFFFSFFFFLSFYRKQLHQAFE